MKKQIAIAAFVALAGVASAQTVIISKTVGNGDFSGAPSELTNGGSQMPGWTQTFNSANGVNTKFSTNNSTLTSAPFGPGDTAHMTVWNDNGLATITSKTAFSAVVGSTVTLNIDTIFNGPGSTPTGDCFWGLEIVDATTGANLLTLKTLGTVARDNVWSTRTYATGVTTAFTNGVLKITAGAGTGSTLGNDVEFDRVHLTVPEPSVALLGGIGALALLRRRRN